MDEKLSPKLVFLSDSKGDEGKRSENIDLDIKWEENCGRMPYDYSTKTIDLGNMLASAYKYNKLMFTL